MRKMRRLIALGAVVALVALACGDSSTTNTAPAEALPPAPIGAEPPPDPAGPCLEGEPDCEDTLDPNDAEPIDLPSDGGSSGMVVDGGLTVADALAGGAEGLIAVHGFIVADDTAILLCELLAESLPPQCGGASIGVASLDSVDPDDLSTAQGVTWTDQPVTILGRIVDGVLTPDPFAQ